MTGLDEKRYGQRSEGVAIGLNSANIILSAYLSKIVDTGWWKIIMTM
jgi:hypothetical protein